MPSDVPPAPLGSASLDEHRRRGRASVAGVTKGRVLVLNATFEPINICTVRRAAVLILKEKAEVIEHGRWELHAESLTLPRPIVIRLITYVRVPRDTHRRKGDALLRQVGMSLRRKPRRPRAHVFIHVASPSIPPAWRAYLPDAA